jgi:uncharacterized iron-regulated membrane protein
VTLDHVAAVAEQHHMMTPYQISMPQGVTGVYSVRTLSGDLRETMYLHLDQYSGEILASIPFADLKPLARAVSMGISIHDGRLWGRANQVFGLMAAAGSFFIAVMGALLWWSRRPKGKLGGPAVLTEASVPRSVAGITALLGIAFPLVGASMVFLWAADRVVRPLWTLRKS